MSFAWSASYMRMKVGRTEHVHLWECPNSYALTQLTPTLHGHRMDGGNVVYEGLFPCISQTNHRRQLGETGRCSARRGGSS